MILKIKLRLTHINHLTYNQISCYLKSNNNNSKISNVHVLWSGLSCPPAKCCACI